MQYIAIIAQQARLRVDTPVAVVLSQHAAPAFGDRAGMVGVGVLGDAVDEDEGHSGLRPPGWRMIARTLPETMAGLPCYFLPRGSSVIVTGHQPLPATQSGRTEERAEGDEDDN